MSTDEKKAPRLSWPIRILLIASLGANLAIAGLAVGFVFVGSKHGNMPPPPREAAAPYTRALDSDQRKALFNKMRKDFKGDRIRPGDLANEYSKAIQLLRAEPFDAVAYEALLMQQSERAHARLVAGQKALASNVAGMTPKQRAAFADRIEDEITRLGKRKDEWRSPKKYD
jgi:uncharacterized membrane protein